MVSTGEVAMMGPDRGHTSQQRRTMTTGLYHTATYAAFSKAGCIFPRVKTPRSPPRWALLQSLSFSAMAANVFVCATMSARYSALRGK